MKFIYLVLFLFVVGCSGLNNVKQAIDYSSFGFSGGTLFSKPSLVTTKEVHFDAGNLIGREVIIEGRIESKGKFDTHLVISDDSGRLLVVLTHIDNAQVTVTVDYPDRLRELGSVERGKKGMPYILAKSLNLQSSEEF